MKYIVLKNGLWLQLYQYPGYDSTELTALPDEIPIVEMLEKAVSAHMQLHKKVQCKVFTQQNKY